MLVFKLGGTEQLQPPALRDRSIPEQVLTDVSDEDLASGERLYFKNCATCHDFAARAFEDREQLLGNKEMGRLTWQ